MFFRFAAGLFLVVLVSMAGIRLEKQTLELRRAVSVQYYQTDLLLELLVRLRLETQKRTAAAQLALVTEAAAEKRTPGPRDSGKPVTAGRSESNPAQSVDHQDSAAELPADSSRIPLLRFRQPFSPKGID